MGLADIKGEKAFDALADMLEPMLNIASDTEAMQYFKAVEVPEGVDPQEFALQRTKDLLPILMKQHKNDLIAILAAMEGKSTKQYTKDLTVPGLLNSVYSLMTDPSFRAFLA